MTKNYASLCAALATCTTIFCHSVLGQSLPVRSVTSQGEATTHAASPANALPAPMAAGTPLGYTADNAVNTVTPYVDLGTTGTAISVGVNTDDGTSAPVNIGFPFIFRGLTFTQFRLNTNGFIKLGTAAPSSDALFFPDAEQSYLQGAINSTNRADTNIISVLNHDLGPSSTSTQPQFRIAVTGTAPQRVATIQWKYMCDKPMSNPTLPAMWSRLDFQIKLYETTNWIEFVYGTFTQAAGVADNWKGYGVGLRGNSNAPDQLLIASHLSTTSWTGTFFTNITSYVSDNGNQHNIRPNFPPNMGRTYRFTRPLNKNVRARELVGLPDFRSCTNPSDARIGMIVSNSGTEDQINIPATLEIAGTQVHFTIPSLAANETDTVFHGPVDFSGVGSYIIRGWTSLPGDQIPQNDSARSDTVVSLGPLVPNLAPDTNSFENQKDNDGWRVYLYNDTQAGRNATWRRFVSDSGNANGGASYWMAPRTAAVGRPNEWFISSCLEMDSGQTYAVGFSYRTQGVARQQILTLYTLTEQLPDSTFPFWGRLLDQGNSIIYRDTIVRFQANHTGLTYVAFRLSGAAANSQVYLDDIFFKLDTGIFIANKPVLGSKFTLAPNPARNRITVKGPNLPKSDLYALSADGKRIRIETERTAVDERSLRIGHLKPGMYVLITANGRQLGRFARLNE